MNSIPFGKKCIQKKKSKDNTFRYVFLASPSAKLREARIVRRVLERPSTFSFLLWFIHSIFLPLPPPAPLFIHFSFHAIHPFRFFAFPFPPPFFLFFFSVFDQSRRFLLYFVSCFLVGGSPRASASFTKKGARREARGEERRYAGYVPDTYLRHGPICREKLFSQCKGMDRARRQHRRGP